MQMHSWTRDMRTTKKYFFASWPRRSCDNANIGFIYLFVCFQFGLFYKMEQILQVNMKILIFFIFYGNFNKVYLASCVLPGHVARNKVKSGKANLTFRLDLVGYGLSAWENLHIQLVCLRGKICIFSRNVKTFFLRIIVFNWWICRCLRIWVLGIFIKFIN